MPKAHNGPLEEYPDSYLTCRTNTHAWVKEHWSPVTGATARQVVGWDRTMSCAVCPATQVTEYDRDLEPVTRAKISYPDGYLAARGQKFSRAEARRERIRRIRSVR